MGLQKHTAPIYMDRNQNGGCPWTGLPEDIFWVDDAFYLNPGNGCVRVSKFIKVNKIGTFYCI